MLLVQYIVKVDIVVKKELVDKNSCVHTKIYKKIHEEFYQRLGDLDVARTGERETGLLVPSLPTAECCTSLEATSADAYLNGLTGSVS